MLDLLGKGKNMPAVVSSLAKKCLLLLIRKANFNFILPHIRERVSVEHTFSGKHFGANLKDTSKSQSTIFSPSIKKTNGSAEYGGSKTSATLLMIQITHTVQAHHAKTQGPCKGSYKVDISISSCNPPNHFSAKVSTRWSLTFSKSTTLKQSQ